MRHPEFVGVCVFKLLKYGTCPMRSSKLINPLTVSRVCVCMYVCMYVYVCVGVCVCAHAHAWEMPGLSLLRVNRAVEPLFLINLF